jgi:hypothetical protein
MFFTIVYIFLAQHKKCIKININSKDVPYSFLPLSFLLCVLAFSAKERIDQDEDVWIASVSVLSIPTSTISIPTRNPHGL